MIRLSRIVIWVTAPLVLAVALFTLGVVWPLPDVKPVVNTQPFAFVGVTLIDVERLKQSRWMREGKRH